MINLNKFIWEVTKEVILKNIELMKISRLMLLFNRQIRFPLQLINIINATNLLGLSNKIWKCSFIKLNNPMSKIFLLNFLKLKMPIKELPMKFNLLTMLNKMSLKDSKFMMNLSLILKIKLLSRIQIMFSNLVQLELKLIVILKDRVGKAANINQIVLIIR